MPFDFDTVINRWDTNSAKWDAIKMRYPGKDILPMWVADMDFTTAPPVIEALKKRAEQGVFGYVLKSDSYNEAVLGWVKRRHGWDLSPDWLCNSPGVVTALGLCIHAYTQPGDKVIVMPPVYYPFFRVILNNGRQLVTNPLILDGEKYTIDFDDLSKKADAGTRLMIISSPHNPIGRLWTREELDRLGRFCVEHDIVLVSDEVHCDLIYRGKRHVPTASFSNEIAEITVSCMAPSKTFNLAGLKTSVIIIPSAKLRRRFQRTLMNLSLGGDSAFGLAALEAAYTEGDAWLDELLVYLEDNMDFTIRYFQENAPLIKAFRSEGTYLLWLDCRGLGLDPKALDAFMLDRAGVWLDDGRLFGEGGAGFQRLNFACPRATLEEGLSRIARAVGEL